MQLTDITNFLGITNTKASEEKPPVIPTFDPEKEGERKVLYKCTVPARVEKKSFSPKISRTMIVVVAVICLLLIIMQEFFLILVIASLVFISYVLAATPPEEVTYEITNHGINYAGQFYFWGDLKYFFFTQEEDAFVLNVDVRNKLPGRLFLTVRGEDKNQIHEIFQRYLPFLAERPQSFLDKAYSSIADKFDFEAK